jgi:hypothetical protein
VVALAIQQSRGKKGSKTTRKEKEENALIRRVKLKREASQLYYFPLLPPIHSKYQPEAHLDLNLFFFFFFSETRKRLIAIKKMKKNHRNE